jgi:excinuclease UvrABC nuclease subunit
MLSVAETRRVPQDVPGVYLLHSYSCAHGGYATFYAGKSFDLRRRLRQHLGERTTKVSIRAAKELAPAYWSAAPVFDAAEMGLIEASLIATLRPCCNQHIPDSQLLYVNLPPLSVLTAFEEEESYD